jgi:hypothetical protein
MAGGEGASHIALVVRENLRFDSALSLRYKGLMADEQTPPGEPGDIPGERSGERMHRIRVGLTGLAVVLLLVVVATLLFNKVGGQGESNASTTAAAKANISADEPLADLGITPGAPANEAAATKAK